MTKTQNNAVLEVWIVLIQVLLFALFPLLPENGVMGAATITAGLTLLSWLRGGRISFPTGVFCSVCMCSVLAGIPFSQVWLGLGVAVHILLCKRSKRLAGGVGWLKRGTFGRDVVLPVIGFTLTAAVALVVWFFATAPDIENLVHAFVPDWNLALLVAGGLVFSMINAAVEEGAYRGVIMQAMDKAVGPGRISIALQAAAFGTLHIKGFPRGWSGVLLAAVFGVFMGTVRRRADGMLAPWIAHVCIDMVILCLVLIYVRNI